MITFEVYRGNNAKGGMRCAFPPYDLWSHSMKCGTIPIVRATGGLADTVTPVGSPTGTGTGFVFSDYTPEAFLQAIHEALEAYKDQKLWHRIMQNAMGLDFSWTKSAQAYLELCRQLV